MSHLILTLVQRSSFLWFLHLLGTTFVSPVPVLIVLTCSSDTIEYAPASSSNGVICLQWVVLHDINFYFSGSNICVLKDLDNASVVGAVVAGKTSCVFVLHPRDPLFLVLGITPQILPPDAAVDVASLIRVPNSNPNLVRVDSNSVVMFATHSKLGVPSVNVNTPIFLIQSHQLAVLAFRKHIVHLRTCAA